MYTGCCRTPELAELLPECDFVAAEALPPTCWRVNDKNDEIFVKNDRVRP
jgi:hypothetical protein